MAEYKVTGTWYLASPPSEGPRHRVTIAQPFEMGTHEVTVGQFRKFAEATGYRTTAESDGKGGGGRSGNRREQRPEFSWKNLGFEQADDQAVVNVTWSEYCLDRYAADAYGESPATDPAGPVEGSEHVVRGGSWATLGIHCRPAFRGGDSGPGHRNQRDGFRVVRCP